MPVDTVDIIVLNYFEVKLLINFYGLCIDYEQVYFLLLTKNHLLTTVIIFC